MRDYTLIDGDLLDADAEFICHQVNCQGKLGSGVAKAIHDKYPQVFEQYIKMYSLHYKYNQQDKLLGQIQIVRLYKEQSDRVCFVVNMFAQDKYGYDGNQYTSVDAFKKCLESINKDCAGYTVAFPWLIGCVRGGAKWDEILPLIINTLTDVKEIKFYKL